MTLFLALRGQDRALSLVPTWMLLLVWLFGAGDHADRAGCRATSSCSGLTAGLVLIVVLIGFTVTQYAFRSVEPLYRRAQPGEQQLRALAVDGAGAAVWEWNARRDEIKVSPVVEAIARPQAPASSRPRSTISPSTCTPPTASASSCCCGP